MRDRLEEPFEFRARKGGASTSSRRPKDSFRVGALALVFGVSVLCAVCWPSRPKSASPDAVARDAVATSESSYEESYEESSSVVNIAPRGGVEDLILNDVRSDFDVSALELADASLIDREETQDAKSLENDAENAPQNAVVSTVYEERREKTQITSSSFETQVESTSDAENDENESAQIDRSTDKRVVKEGERNPRAESRASYDASRPGYFARAANLPGGHNSFSLRNFARAANLVGSDGAYSPRSITSAAQVDDSKVEAR